MKSESGNPSRGMGGVPSVLLFRAEIPIRSPRKLLIIIIKKMIFWLKVSKKYFIYKILKQKHWVITSNTHGACAANIRKNTLR